MTPVTIVFETTELSFAAGETIVLDPEEIDTSRVGVDITALCRAEGLDWGDAQIEQYMAQAQRGQLPVDYRVPNRTITIPLSLRSVAGMDFFEARSLIQAKVGLFQRQGGSIKRLTGVGAVYADVVGASLHLGGGLFQAVGKFDIDATLTLETIPDFYQDEIELDPHLSVTNEVSFTETAAGDFPGRVRIYVGSGSVHDQRGLIWSVRHRNYSSAITAQPGYDTGDLTVLDSATVFGSGVQHADLSTNWTPVVATDIDGSGPLTHEGTYRVWVQATSPSATVPEVRLVWDVGDLSLPTTNTPVRLQSNNNLYWVDLGEVRLEPAALGFHKWSGMIQARGTVGGEQVVLGRLLIVNTDDGYGVLRAPFTSNIGGFFNYLARDEFNQTAGNLTGKTAAVGGVWAGAGDATDFTVDAGGHIVKRAALSDATNVGRYAISGAGAFSSQVVQVDVTPNAVLQAGINQKLGVVGRYVDTNNWLMAALCSPTQIGVSNSLPAELTLWKRVAGTITELSKVYLAPWFAYANFSVTLQMSVDTDGHCTVRAGLAGSGVVNPVSTVQDDELATGGPLASGSLGFYDEYPFAAGTDDIRRYDNFSVWSPETDAVLFNGLHMQIATDGAIRGINGDLNYAPVTSIQGDLPRFPPGGLEGSPAEFFLRSSRGDFDSLPDGPGGSDGIGAAIFYRPSWLFVPGLAESVVISETV